METKFQINRTQKHFMVLMPLVPPVPLTPQDKIAEVSFHIYSAFNTNHYVSIPWIWVYL